MEKPYVDDFTIRAETDNAILLRTDGEDGEDVWIPFSQIEEIHRDGNRARVVMSAWIAKQKGLYGG